MRHKQLIALAALVVALTGTVFGEQGGGVIRREEAPPNTRDIQRSGVNFSSAWRPAGTSGFTRVIGTVIDIRQIPVPKATVQLRNLDTGNVEQTVESNDAGEYQFEIEDPSTFVVEMVMVDGYVLALSNAGSLARYETLNTVVQLPGRWDLASRTMSMPQAVTSFFGMSAQTTMTATTLQIAIEQEVKPTDPGRPVSPS